MATTSRAERVPFFHLPSTHAKLAREQPTSPTVEQIVDRARRIAAGDIFPEDRFEYFQHMASVAQSNGLPHAQWLTHYTHVRSDEIDTRLRSAAVNDLAQRGLVCPWPKPIL